MEIKKKNKSESLTSQIPQGKYTARVSDGRDVSKSYLYIHDIESYMEIHGIHIHKNNIPND